jgi:hypothetical protein
MEKCKQVVVYGTSLNMAVIAASLRADSTLEVVSIASKSPPAQESLHKIDLAAIIFDLNDPSLGLNLSLLRDRPDLLLIGVDPSRGEIRVFSSRSAQALSISDLVHVIHQKDSSFKQSPEEKGIPSSKGVNHEE